MSEPIQPDRDDVPDASSRENPRDQRDERRANARSVTEQTNGSRKSVLMMAGVAVMVIGTALVIMMRHSDTPASPPQHDAPQIAEDAATPPAASAPPAASVPDVQSQDEPASDANAQAAAQLAERARALDAREAKLQAAEQALLDARRKSDVFAEEPSGQSDNAPATPSQADDNGQSVLQNAIDQQSNPRRSPDPDAIGEGGHLQSVSYRGENARADSNTTHARDVAAEDLEVAHVGQLRALQCKILPGRILEGRLLPRVISDLPGMVTIMLTRDAFGEKGRIPLMPWGTRITARPNPVVTAGQERNFIVSARAFLPNGQTIKIGSSVADQLGSAGLDSQVDHHYAQILGMSAVLSLLGAGASNIGVAGGDQNNSASMYRSNVQSSLAQTAQQQLNGYANIPPTLKNDQGTKVRIMVEKVLDFGDRCARQQEG
ncbi:TraB/TrbI/VirB10 family type IV secretion system protein [Burkholderia cepacia]|uniref:TrbI/VirB10 family protein n=1 Tax=Burkholderia cepacia TaxID=292 RepID=UPI002ABD852C|nr:TrbI/VirB10 family protein [Burkholderia cepacia]